MFHAAHGHKCLPASAVVVCGLFGVFRMLNRRQSFTVVLVAVVSKACLAADDCANIDEL